MAIPKVKQSSGIKITEVFCRLERHRIAFQGTAHLKYPEKNFYLDSTKILSQTYLSHEYPGADVFDEWCKYVETISIDLKCEFDPSTSGLELCGHFHRDFWQPVLSEFMVAIKDHREQQAEFSCVSQISEKSLKQFLCLVPIFALHRARVYIDSNNGCVNVDFPTRDNGILSTQISENGQIHYSYVARNNKIFKITGTAKFKDTKDFIKFNKVMKML